MLERVITTSRLILRPPELSDAEAIHTSYAQDPEVSPEPRDALLYAITR